MIKLTHIPSDTKTDRFAVIIAGGPGLSSYTLRSLDILKRSLNLVYVDFHGTNDVPYLKDASYEELVEAFRKSLAQNLFVDSEVFLIGHSFGGFFAASVANLPIVKGLFALGVPFSKETVQALSDCYSRSMNPALAKAEKHFDEKKDDQSFREWLAEYGRMYFLDDRGRDLILEDKVSAKFYLANTNDISKGEALLDQLATLKKLKVMVAGKQDGLIPARNLEEDAARGIFQFLVIDGASHFMTFDQPEVVARLIEENIATVK